MKELWKNKHFKFLLLTILVSLPILVYKDIPVSHDILFHLTRIKGLSRELSINPYNIFIFHNMLNNMGYGIPLFYSSLFLYPFAFLYKGCSLVAVYKIMIISINLCTVYTIDFVLRRLTNDEKIINYGTILYLFSSYRMVDLYVRGAIGETLSFIFIPLIFLGLDRIINGDKRQFYYLVIGMTGVIYSHVISSYIVCLFIFFYLLFNIRKIFTEKRYLYLIYSVIITFLLTSAFILPLFEQLIDRRFYIYYLDQMNTHNNIYAPLYKTILEIPLPAKEWLPLGIGVTYFLFIIFGIKYRNMLKKDTIIYLIIGVLFIILSTNIVPRFVYDKVLYFIQYQWRFYMIATVSLFFFGIQIHSYLNKKETIILKYAFICSLIVLLSFTITTNMIYDKTNSLNFDYLGFYEYLPKGVSVDDSVLNKVKYSSNNEIDCQIKYDNGKTIVSYTNNHYNDTVITLPLLYYKGYVSNKDYDIINKEGMVSIKLDNFSDTFVVYYEGTQIAYLGRIISLISIIVIISIYMRKRSCNVKNKSSY